MKNNQQFDTDKAWGKLYDRIVDDKVISFDKKSTLKNKTLLTMVASIAILIGVASFYFLSNKTVVYINNSLAVKVITLPDSSKVYMNSMSELSFDNSFGDNTRSLSLKGEAFFKVTKDKFKPFVVNTYNATITVLGTSFNVNATTKNIKVIVKTGKVSVSNHNTSVTLLPGDKCELIDANTIIKSNNENYNYISWINKKLIFKSKKGSFNKKITFNYRKKSG